MINYIKISFLLSIYVVFRYYKITRAITIFHKKKNKNATEIKL